LSRQRYNRDFNNCGGSHFDGPRGYRGPAGLFGLVFSLVSLGLTIAFNVLGIVLHVFSDLAGKRTIHGNQPPRQDFGQQEPKKQAQQASTSTVKAETDTTAKKEKQSTIKKEQVKETLNQTKEEHTSDWNILLFVITLIPVIITLAMKRLDLAGLVLLGGTTLIVIYNIFRSAIISAKKRKKQRVNVVKEEKKEETEIERVIKEAFDKVYAIRKELYRISNQEIKGKLEGLCTMAEKIIGEVRDNPECMNSVRKFFYYYLDAFTEVFEKYAKLSSFSASSEEVQKLLTETEKSFEDMEKIFKDMCEGMLEKDMLNLKATINVIKNSNYNN
jgi:5-bromo-4-chloroindolyl phosphate hydrolysis protein